MQVSDPLVRWCPEGVLRPHRRLSRHTACCGSTFVVMIPLLAPPLHVLLAAGLVR